MELLDIDPADYRIFDFDESGAKSIRLRAYELTDGEWNCVAHSAYETVDGGGRIALTFGKMTEGVRMAHKDGAGLGRGRVRPLSWIRKSPWLSRSSPRKMKSAPMTCPILECRGSTPSTAMSTSTPSP